ncbi:MAG TPA: metal ABC transporter permease [Candidatus Hydrogenedentes bacterium]|jgi:zinc transport system permease protein|nr:metal ABC transporter permease [Candidatus Hydrogenedentota bacterium]HQE76108.1 metal ABC transporter permease [Candidatus Hydrogenedentota bacterium]HQH68872.1 metal ABC transporter permease [Candidatus Hydrogenedentota bacterium]HQK76854.1 metal ABC transporter permease [Candidatus Hydrogenedentota bacterium]HQM33491.1 metal ABC transporter permease [Candidatus Hydrogenedentota bacterium]
MHEFLQALLHPDIPVLRHAMLVGVLSSVAFGIVGTFVVTRRITFIAAAIAHCVLGGIGAALYLRARFGLTWLEPIYGALPAALMAALIIGIVSLRAREREDTVIGAVWAVGMALGLLLLAKTPGYNKDTMSYLFGDILLIARRDVWLVAGLDLVVVAVAVFFYNKLLAVCFDEEFARTRGLAVERYYLLLLCLIAVTIVLLVYLVGIVLVIALLTLPAAVAGQFSRRMAWIMGIAVLLCMVFSTAGIALSYPYDLPSGPTIIVTGAAVYLAVLAVKRLRRGLGQSVR